MKFYVLISEWGTCPSDWGYIPQAVFRSLDEVTIYVSTIENTKANGEPKAKTRVVDFKFADKTEPPMWDWGDWYVYELELKL